MRRRFGELKKKGKCLLLALKLESSNAILKNCLFASDIVDVASLMTGIIQALRVADMGKGAKQG